ncbi:MAG: hypothetical protein EPN91_07550 [Salinibacterium sp.]|nr:MAG: hypothetical protein EPN91_07550 [Salinibacterium sp.]
MRVQLEATGLEFEEDGNTIWVHGLRGTILRIQCTGKIRMISCDAGATPHADVKVHGDIAMCVPDGPDKEFSNVH